MESPIRFFKNPHSKIKLYNHYRTLRNNDIIVVVVVVVVDVVVVVSIIYLLSLKIIHFKVNFSMKSFSRIIILL